LKSINERKSPIPADMLLIVYHTSVL